MGKISARPIRKPVGSLRPLDSAAHTVKDPEKRVFLGILYVALCTVLLLGNLHTIAFAQSSCNGIHAKILNIRNSAGMIACALFESPDGFPVEYLRFATNIIVIKVRDKQARCDFQDIAPGTYALVVAHDENMNGILDTNWLGMPTEGYGFSNDERVWLSAPSFPAASFLFDGKNMDLTVDLHY